MGSLYRRTSCPRANGRPQTSSACFARAGTTRGGRAIRTCATAVVAQLLKIQLQHRSTQHRSTCRRLLIQTVQHILISALLPIPVRVDCVEASGVTADQQLDIAEIAARVEIVGLRNGNQVIPERSAIVLQSTKLVKGTWLCR